MKSKYYSYPCNDCQHLEVDECGPSCSKQLEGLPFKERLIKCKHFLLREKRSDN